MEIKKKKSAKLVFNSQHWDKGNWHHKTSDRVFKTGQSRLSVPVRSDLCITVTCR